MKISIIGAGSVGTTSADNIARNELVDQVVLLDLKENIVTGKALDLTQTSSLLGYETKIVASANDYEKTKNSHIAVITSGAARKPGMSREDLLEINAKIVKDVTSNVLKYSPNVIFVVISNPMDVMTYLTIKSLNHKKNKVIGMGGALDSARFKTYLSLASGFSQNDIHAMVIGGHGDTLMIPLTRLATCQGIPFSEFLSKEQLEQVKKDTMVGGATLTKYLGISAWYAPGAAVAYLVESIIRDQKKIIPCSVLLEGEYGIHDVCIGVPTVISKNGVENILEINLDSKEKEELFTSANSIKSMVDVLKDRKLL